MEGLSVIIPVKPPEPYLQKIFRDIDKVLRNIPHEILIQYEKGLTNAVITGAKKSRYPIIGVIDADGSHDPQNLYYMHLILSTIPNLDLVIGSKRIMGGQDLNSPGRRFISEVFRKLANFMLDLKVGDPMSGLIMGKRALFTKLKTFTEYKWPLQILCYNPPPRVVEIPIIFNKRQGGKSKTSIKTGLKALHSIMKLWWKKYALF